MTCAATAMWFSPFVDWWLEWPNPLARDRLSRNPADMDQRGSAAELLVDQGLWVKGFVGKTLWVGKALGFEQDTLDQFSSVVNSGEWRGPSDNFQNHCQQVGFDMNHRRARQY